MAENGDVFEYNELNANELKEIAEIYCGGGQEVTRVGPKGYYVFKQYKKMASDIYNMPLRPTDVFVASYQRSGTTWTQELVWILTNDFNYEKAAAVPLTQRYAFLELAMFFDDASIERSINQSKSTNFEKAKQILDILSTPATEFLAVMPSSSPRFVKTHLPMSLLPPNMLDTVKVVYVARDPRDVIVSCCHHSKLFKITNLTGDFKLFWNAFRKNLFILTPYFEHVKEAWALRHHPNMMFLFYEDLSKDLPESIRRVANFLGKEMKQEQLERLCDHLSIENFKNNKSVNYEDMRDIGFLDDDETFIRKGKTGGWREYFDEEMTMEADRWIADNLGDTDLRFPSMENK